MGYDRGDSFPFDFEPSGIPFGSKLKGKLSPRSYPIQFEWKWKHSFLSAALIAVVSPVWFTENMDSLICASSQCWKLDEIGHFSETKWRTNCNL